MSMSAAGARRPGVAGLFYPDNPQELEKKVRYHLQQNTASRIGFRQGADTDHKRKPTREEVGPVIFRGLYPHAAYSFTGEILGRLFAQIALSSPQSIFFIVAPSHREPKLPLVLPTAEHFTTPLGAVPVYPLQDQLKPRESSYFSLDMIPHEEEHGIELALPFIQVIQPQASLVPIITSNNQDKRKWETLQRVISTIVKKEQKNAAVLVTGNLLQKTVPELTALDQAPQEWSCFSRGITAIANFWDRPGPVWSHITRQESQINNNGEQLAFLSVIWEKVKKS